MYRLQFKSGRNKGKRLLVRQASAVVGSAKGCTVRLREKDCPLAQVCRLEKRLDGVAAVALDAEFPLLFNGKLLDGEGLLRHGDVLSIGEVDVQYQEIIPPGGPRLNPGGGVLGPIAWLAIMLIVGAELSLLAVTSNWPKYLIEENTEKIDIAYAAKQRQLRGETVPEEGKEQPEKKGDASSIIVMPGASLGTDGETNGTATATAEAGGGDGRADGTPAATNGEQETTAAAAAELLETMREALTGADFERAELGDMLAGLPVEAVYDPVKENIESLLTEAKAAAQFSDYPRAFLLLNQIHQLAPGYLPAHIYHARLLESRGDLTAAYRRWKQLLGLVGKDSSERAEILQAGRKLQKRLRLQKNVSGYAGVDPETLPRRLRIEPPTMQKMPADSEIAEMRILRGKIVPGEHAEGGDGAGSEGGTEEDAETDRTEGKTAEGRGLDEAKEERAEEDEKVAVVQLFITFYDQVPGGSIVPTRALVSPSPMNLTAGGANAGGTLEFEATYIVPAVRREDTQELMPHASIYCGYTLHLFVDGVLQDAYAQPDRLLELPIHVATPADDL